NISGFHDPRQHAVSLAFVVPVSGDCQPTQRRARGLGATPARRAGRTAYGSTPTEASANRMSRS
ncbi:MAG: DUF4916 domain-containing protein, partial [Acidimicrobiia bacterium]|nr:DUF4916 domain-containing protein [Acidimicrobiia bacterium]